METIQEPRDDVAALFVPDGPDVLPTIYAMGPWRPDALHGAAVAALFADVLERSDMAFARITLDLVGAVRLRPLRVSVDDLGGGSRVQRRSASLHDGDRVVARASALYVAPGTTEDPNDAAAHPPPQTTGDPPGPLDLLPESRAGWPGFENRSMALHTTGDGQGNFLGWFRLLVPAVAGRPMTGLQRALTAADYSSGGTATLLSFRKWSFMSIDLTVNLTREPTGDWVGVTADRSTLGQHGIGIAASVLHDHEGAFGRCTQTQLLQRMV